MKKLFKVVLVLVALVVIFLIVGSIALHIYLPPEKAKALVLDKLSSQLKREVTLGSVDVGILSGLQIHDLKISESPNFSKGTFISSDLFSLKIALTPLLFRKVIVRQILLRKPVVNVIRNADGKTFNFSDLTQPSDVRGPKSDVGRRTSDDKSLPFLLLVSRAEIQNGAVHFVDHSPAKQSMDIAPLDIRLNNLSLTKPFSLQSALELKSKGTALDLNFAGQANPVEGSFTIKQGSLVSRNTKILLSGSVNRLKTPEPTIDLKVDIPKLEVADLAGFVALPPELKVSGPYSAHATLKGNQKLMVFAASLDGTKSEVQYGTDFLKPVGIPLDASVMGEVPSLESMKVLIHSLQAHLGQNLVTGSGTYETRGTQGIVNFAAKGANWSVADLAKVSPLLNSYHPTGTLSFDAHATGPTSALQTVVQTSGDMSCPSVNQDSYEGKNLQLKWNLTDVTPDVAKVSGTAALRQGPGKIMNVDKLAASSRYGKILLAPLQTIEKIQQKGLLKGVNLPSLATVTFDSIVGDYVLRTGVVTIKDFNLNGSQLAVQNQGTVGLTGVQPINIIVTMKLAAGSIGGTMGEILKDENGRPTVKFSATGPAANPKVALDTKETEKKAAQVLGKELMKNKDVQNAIDQLQNNLKGLFH